MSQYDDFQTNYAFALNKVNDVYPELYWREKDAFAQAWAMKEIGKDVDCKFNKEGWPVVIDGEVQRKGTDDETNMESRTD